jgi:hypothetical protein
LNEAEAILYSTHKYGLIDSIAVPPESENADTDSLRLYLSDGVEEEKFKVTEVLEEKRKVWMMFKVCSKRNMMI